MGRPRKGEKGAEEATNKWRATMIKRYGSEEAYKDMMRNAGRRGGTISRGGGFASTKVGADGLTGRQRARLVGSIGGFSRRGKKRGGR